MSVVHQTTGDEIALTREGATTTEAEAVDGARDNISSSNNRPEGQPRSRRMQPCLDHMLWKVRLTFLSSDSVYYLIPGRRTRSFLDSLRREQIFGLLLSRYQ